MLKGSAPYVLKEQVYESLMARSWDEPFSLYGLLAESIETPEDRRWVVFHLNPKARFSTGDPVRPEDVLWTVHTLIEQGKPNYAEFFRDVTQMKKIGPHAVRFDFAKSNRELPLMLGLMPVLSKKAESARKFGSDALTPLVGSGPYRVGVVEPGRLLTLERDPNYWGRELPANRGRHNFDVVEYQFYRDSIAQWEAFKAGQVSILAVNDPAKWRELEVLPAMIEGRIKRAEIEHSRASGMRGFVFNTRRPLFDDRRVRQALSLAFDFKWLNERLFEGTYRRIESYFSGSELAHAGAAGGLERALLIPFKDSLPDGVLDSGWRPTDGIGDGRNRVNLRRARELLMEAGWEYRDGALRNALGQPFVFEMLLTSYSDERVAQIFSEALEPLGIQLEIRIVDDAQFRERLMVYDFDMTVYRWWLSLSPGDEQRLYWGSLGVDTPGTRNYMGVDSPAVEAMIDTMLAAKSREEFRAAVKALDRVLSAGVYVIPFWEEKADRYAWWDEMARPEVTPLYGYRPDVWWMQGVTDTILDADTPSAGAAPSPAKP
ncbi:MAG: extracellular solute-binding protein [Neomegalonema sp.]|nr:extracellular solute-binding protein [Neomegalonema sp.]